MSTEQPDTYALQIGAATDVGNERDTNEDRFLAECLDWGDGNPWQLTAVLMVADGVGGHDAGEVASGIAYDTVNEQFIQGKTWSVLEAGSDWEIKETILEVIETINRKVYSYGSSQQGRPATTLTLCLCREGSYHIGHVGDSRAYLLSDGIVTQITDDDSWVADAVRQGKMTPLQAESSPFRNQLTKSIGGMADVKARYYSGPLNNGDTLLLCSDGLSEYVQADEMQGALYKEASLQSACEYLIDLAKHRGGHDNITVATAGFGARTIKARKPPTKPVEIPKPPTRRLARSRSSLQYTNFLMKSVLLLLICAASTVMGLYMGRQWIHRKTRLAPRIHTMESDKLNSADGTQQEHKLNDGRTRGTGKESN